MEKQIDRRTLLKLTLGAAAAIPALTASAQSKPETFSIFFEYGSTELGDGARKIVDTLTRSISPRGRVTIAGYCDTAEQVPEKLGYSRANAVLTEFLRHKDMARVRFNVVNEGVSRLLVQTPPNTKEPRNRRVEVIVTV